MTVEYEVVMCKPPFYENSYFLYNKKDKEFAVIDPGDGTAAKSEELLAEDYHLKLILITHVHIDHTWDLRKICDLAPKAEVILHPEEFKAVFTRRRHEQRNYGNRKGFRR